MPMNSIAMSATRKSKKRLSCIRIIHVGKALDVVVECRFQSVVQKVVNRERLSVVAT